ncbi:MAG: hypothetical protein WC891_08790 [Actinomycetota bacterium]
MKSLIQPNESVPDFVRRLNKLAEEKAISTRFPLETVRMWLNGFYKPQLDAFHELAKCTGRSPMWLYDGTGPEELVKFNKRLKRYVEGEARP